MKKIDKGMISKIFITISLIIIFIAILIGINIFLDKREEKRLENEILEVNSLLNAKTLDEDKLNKRLDKIVTKNDYSKIEKAYKNFLKDNLSNLNKIENYYNHDGKKIYQMLNIENIKEDGKEFTNSLNLLASSRKTLTDLKDDYNASFEEDKMMSYLDTKDLKKYYINFYRNEIVKGLKETKEEKKLSEELGKSISDIDNITKALNYLKDNSKYWSIKKNEINWTDEKKMNEYVEIVSKIS